MKNNLIFLFLLFSCTNIEPPVSFPTPIPSPSPTVNVDPTNTPTAVLTNTTVPTVVPSVTNTPTTTPTSTSVPTITPTIVTSTEVIKSNVYLTFYGYDDNDDGNGNYGLPVISDPIIHLIATEDQGTYEHPSTYATDYVITKPGDIIYVPRLKKYYIHEDSCVECTQDRKQGKTRIDLFMGDNDHLQGQPLINCEESYTIEPPYTDVVVFNPRNDYEVNLIPLFSNGKCN